MILCMRNDDLSLLCKICPGTVSKRGRDLAMKKNVPEWYLSAEVWLSAYCLTRRCRSGLPAFRTGHRDGVQPFTKTIRTSRIYHTTTPLNKTPGWSSFCRSVIICLLSHTEVKVWTSGFQNRSSRRSPAFCPKNRTSRIYHTITPSQQDSCGYDKVRPSIVQCTYDIEYCWRSTDITGPSQASSIHLLITASIVCLDQDFRRHPLCIARTSRRFVDTFRLRQKSRKATHLVKPNAESVVWLKN